MCCQLMEHQIALKKTTGNAVVCCQLMGHQIALNKTTGHAVVCCQLMGHQIALNKTTGHAVVLFTLFRRKQNCIILYVFLDVLLANDRKCVSAVTCCCDVIGNRCAHRLTGVGLLMT